MNHKRVGVFGGTFDPVHLGHVQLARSACEQYDFDELIVVPCALPSHRSRAQATNDQRVEMLSLAFSDFTKATVSDYELKKTSLSYTIETLEYFQSQRSQVQWFFCLGGDSLVSFSTWHRWRDILGIANLVVMGRSQAGFDGLLPELYERIISPEQKVAERKAAEKKLIAKKPIEQEVVGKIAVLDLAEIAVSATKIRQRLETYDRNCLGKERGNSLYKIEDDKQLSEWLDPKVLSYISQNKVYQ